MLCLIIILCQWLMLLNETKRANFTIPMINKGIYIQMNPVLSKTTSQALKISFIVLLAGPGFQSDMILICQVIYRWLNPDYHPDAGSFWKEGGIFEITTINGHEARPPFWLRARKSSTVQNCIGRFTLHQALLITIIGTGGTKESFPDISSPLLFRRQFQERDIM